MFACKYKKTSGGKEIQRLRTKRPREKKNSSAYVQKDLRRQRPAAPTSKKEQPAAPTCKKTSGENHKEACSTDVRKRPREERTRSAFLQKDLGRKRTTALTCKKTSGGKELQRLRTKRPREQTTKRPAAPTYEKGPVRQGPAAPTYKKTSGEITKRPLEKKNSSAYVQKDLQRQRTFSA